MMDLLWQSTYSSFHISPKKVMCIHGTNTVRFATEIRSSFGIDAIAPKQGEIIDF